MQRTAFHKTSPVLPGASEVTGGFAGVLLRAPQIFFDSLAAWQHQAEERAHLDRLTDHQLQDMGLSRKEAEGMARKAIWSRRI